MREATRSSAGAILEIQDIEMEVTEHNATAWAITTRIQNKYKEAAKALREVGNSGFDEISGSMVEVRGSSSTDHPTHQGLTSNEVPGRNNPPCGDRY